VELLEKLISINMVVNRNCCVAATIRGQITGVVLTGYCKWRGASYCKQAANFRNEDRNLAEE
jgi:hypothetical protein